MVEATYEQVRGQPYFGWPALTELAARGPWFEEARMRRLQSQLHGILLMLSWLSGLRLASAYAINHSPLSLSSEAMKGPASRSHCLTERQLTKTKMARRENTNSTHAQGCLIGRRAVLSSMLILSSQHAASADERPETLLQSRQSSPQASGPVLWLANIQTDKA